MTSTIDTIDIEEIATRPQAGMRRVSRMAFVAVITGQIVDRAKKRRSRSALRDLTDDQLRDIGLTRSDVKREVAKSFFWD